MTTSHQATLSLAVAAVATCLAGQAIAQSRAGPVLEIEAAAAWQEKNDVQSPNDASGTRFALDRVTGGGPFFAPRAQFSVGLAPRHELRLVVAPLEVKESGSLDRAVNFQGRAFAAGGVEAKYRFDSYRATWRYSIHEDANWKWRAGVTAKIRDAEISLRQGGVTATRSDTGVVPLLHLYGERRLDGRSRLAFEGDGLVGGRGRAFDLSLRYVRDIGGSVSGFAGLRILDGGADNSSIYSFARFQYLTVGLQYRH